MRILHRKNTRSFNQTHDDASNQNTQQQPDPNKDQQPPAKDQGKTFTQEDVNTMMAKDRREHQEKYNKLLSDVERMKKMSDEEKQKLMAEHETVRRSYMSKEELHKEEQAKAAEEAAKKMKSLEDEAKTWKTRYSDSVIDASIMEAAVANEAFNPAQLVRFLKSDAKMVEDGGKFSVVVNYLDGDKTLTLSPVEVVKKMKENSGFANFFKSNIKPGTGGNNEDPSKLDLKDPKQYEAWRKTQNM